MTKKHYFGSVFWLHKSNSKGEGVDPKFASIFDYKNIPDIPINTFWSLVSATGRGDPQKAFSDLDGNVLPGVISVGNIMVYPDGHNPWISFNSRARHRDAIAPEFSMRYRRDSIDITIKQSDGEKDLQLMIICPHDSEAIDLTWTCRFSNDHDEHLLNECIVKLHDSGEAVSCSQPRYESFETLTSDQKRFTAQMVEQIFGDDGDVITIKRHIGYCRGLTDRAKSRFIPRVKGYFEDVIEFAGEVLQR